MVPVATHLDEVFTVLLQTELLDHGSVVNLRASCKLLRERVTGNFPVHLTHHLENQPGRDKVPHLSTSCLTQSGAWMCGLRGTGQGRDLACLWACGMPNTHLAGGLPLSVSSTSDEATLLQNIHVQALCRLAGAANICRVEAHSDYLSFLPRLGSLFSLKLTDPPGIVDMRPLARLPRLCILSVEALLDEEEDDVQVLHINELQHLVVLKLSDSVPIGGLPPLLAGLELWSPAVSRGGHSTQFAAELLHSFQGSLTTLDINMAQFGSDPSRLAALPCLSKLRQLRMQFETAPKAWQVCLPQLQFVSVQFKAESHCKLSWDFSSCQPLDAVVFDFWNASEAIDLRGCIGVRTHLLELAFFDNFRADLRCSARFASWEVQKADVCFRNAGYDEEPIILCVSDVLGALALMQPPPKLRVNGLLAPEAAIQATKPGKFMLLGW